MIAACSACTPQVRLAIDAPGYRPVRLPIRARGHLAYAAVLQPDATPAASRIRPLPSPSRCGR